MAWLIRLLPRSAVALLVAVALIGCGHKVIRTTMRPQSSTGCLVVRINRPVPDLVVTVNGELVSDGERAEKVIVDGVPPGDATVEIVVGGGEHRRVHERRVVRVRPGATHVVAVAAPEITIGSGIWGGLRALGTWIALGLVFAL